MRDNNGEIVGVELDEQRYLLAAAGWCLVRFGGQRRLRIEGGRLAIKENQNTAKRGIKMSK